MASTSSEERLWLHAFTDIARGAIATSCDRVLGARSLATLLLVDVDTLLGAVHIHRTTCLDPDEFAIDIVWLLATLLIGRAVSLNYFIDEAYNGAAEFVCNLETYDEHVRRLTNTICTGDVGACVAVVSRMPPRVGVLWTAGYHTVPLLHRATGQPVVDPRALALMSVLLSVSAGMDRDSAWCVEDVAVHSPGPLEVVKTTYALGARTVALFNFAVCRATMLGRLMRVVLGVERSAEVGGVRVSSTSTLSRIFWHVRSACTHALAARTDRTSPLLVARLESWIGLATRALTLATDRVEPHAEIWKQALVL